MKRAKDVLGKGWELYAEGEQLQSESAALRKKLDARLVFEVRCGIGHQNTMEVR
jgi:dynein heavy chain 1